MEEKDQKDKKIKKDEKDNLEVVIRTKGDKAEDERHLEHIHKEHFGLQERLSQNWHPILQKSLFVPGVYIAGLRNGNKIVYTNADLYTEEIICVWMDEEFTDGVKNQIGWPDQNTMFENAIPAVTFMSIRVADVSWCLDLEAGNECDCEDHKDY